ncbi:MAG: hypothetical protein AABX38_03345 [Candidatus Micrarchaeota archaeon]
MIPEAKLIRNELIIREMSLPEDVKLARKSLIRWIALSLGLIYPNETRQLLLEILDALFYFHAKKEQPTTEQIIAKLDEGKTEEDKVYPKAVYYHILKLKEMGLIDRKKGKIFFGNGDERKISEILKEFYISKVTTAFKDIEEAISRVEDGYK